MKARLHPTPAMQKAIDAYAEAKIQGIQSRAQEAVMKERNDIATRATYLCLLACYQVGLSPRTLKRIQDAMTGPVKNRQSEFLKRFPNAYLNAITRLLPCLLDKTLKPLRCAKYGYLSITCRCDKCRDDYWNEEVDDND